MARRKRPAVLTSCVADRYAAPNERIVEFSFPTGEGGLMSLRTMSDGRSEVELYRVDPAVFIIGARDARALRAFAEQVARLTKDGEETPEHPDGFDMPSDDAVETLAGLVDAARALVGR